MTAASGQILADELVDKALAQTDFDIMFAALVDAGEHIVITRAISVRIDIDHRAIDLEHRDHFLDMRINHQSMGLAGSLIDITAFCGYPVMLKVAP